ncbi:hypothetical protein GW17_00009420, partial [Ensete ventricosum]
YDDDDVDDDGNDGDDDDDDKRSGYRLTVGMTRIAALIPISRTLKMVPMSISLAVRHVREACMGHDLRGYFSLESVSRSEIDFDGVHRGIVCDRLVAVFLLLLSQAKRP